MRVLLDHCVDVRFADLLIGHDVLSTKGLGWQELSNGKLLEAAEQAGFAVFVTVDKNVRHQQNIAKRSLCLVTLNPVLVDFEYISPLAGKLLTLMDGSLQPGSSVVIGP